MSSETLFVYSINSLQDVPIFPEKWISFPRKNFGKKMKKRDFLFDEPDNNYNYDEEYNVGEKSLMQFTRMTKQRTKRLANDSNTDAAAVDAAHKKIIFSLLTTLTIAVILVQIILSKKRKQKQKRARARNISTGNKKSEYNEYTQELKDMAEEDFSADNSIITDSRSTINGTICMNNRSFKIVRSVSDDEDDRSRSSVSDAMISDLSSRSSSTSIQSFASSSRVSVSSRSIASGRISSVSSQSTTSSMKSFVFNEIAEIVIESVNGEKTLFRLMNEEKRSSNKSNGKSERNSSSIPLAKKNISIRQQGIKSSFTGGNVICAHASSLLSDATCVTPDTVPSFWNDTTTTDRDKDDDKQINLEDDRSKQQNVLTQKFEAEIMDATNANNSNTNQPKNNIKNNNDDDLVPPLSLWEGIRNKIDASNDVSNNNNTPIPKYEIVYETSREQELRRKGMLLYQLGQMLRLEGKPEEALEAFKKAEIVHRESLEKTLTAVTSVMYSQALYHHDRCDIKFAVLLLGVAESIRERPTPKNLLFCTRLHHGYREYSSYHAGLQDYTRVMDEYVRRIKKQAPFMAKTLRAQAQCYT